MSTPNWFLWEGGFLLIARAQGVVPSHSHHAIQIVLSLDKPIAVSGAGQQWRMGQALIVRQNTIHSFDCSGALGAMLFVEPESREGAWLQSSLPDAITIVPEARIAKSAQDFRHFLERPYESPDLATIIRDCVQSCSPGAPSSRRMDPRVTNVLNRIRASEDLRISLDSAANMAFLSPSRFAHLFKEQIGLPFSRYVLWRKLTRAMLAIGSGLSIAAAAQAADFADAAHLTRTFYQMVGMPPSVLMRGTFTEITSPFHLYE